jgi:hypothetical protein
MGLQDNFRDVSWPYVSWIWGQLVWWVWGWIIAPTADFGNSPTNLGTDTSDFGY